ncbi:Serine/threonine-protein kinase Nek2 [Phytophthora cinnamomi]|uniref:Serine/threonine-protein kinase Nek2 n=1 Tax=Phytophthora cinnamomi TaxID=4785 RepID=UPI0035593A11|nr:Serine/threonine-protein kinase Nek2 [Phytophthora cinnamomi]
MSPMSFALHLREIDCVRFDAPPVVQMAQYSGRLGSRNLTVMNIRSQSELEQLEKGSSNANFYVDFGAGATLPVTDSRWPTYEDLLAGIGGPISSGDMVWYDHARRLLLRVKRFVLTNMERDNNTPVCATLTLMLVNHSNCCAHCWEAVSLESCLASLTTFTVTSAATQTTVTVPEAAEVAPVRRHFGIRVVPCYR